MWKQLKVLTLQLRDSSLDYRIRLFYVMALGGIAISLLTLVLSLVTAMWSTAAISGMLILLSLALILFTHRTGKFQLAYLITVVLVFMIGFPALFFTSGGHRSGMPAVFMFAVIFTVLMLKGPAAILISLLEILEYGAVCVFAYYHPEYVTFYETEAEILTDIIFAYSAMSIICGIVLFVTLQKSIADTEEHLQAARRLYNANVSRFNTLKKVFPSRLLGKGYACYDFFQAEDHKQADVEIRFH